MNDVFSYNNKVYVSTDGVTARRSSRKPSFRDWFSAGLASFYGRPETALRFEYVEGIMKARRIVTTALIAFCALMLHSGCEEETAAPQQLDPSWFRQFETPAEQAPAPRIQPTVAGSIKQPEPRITFDKLVHNFGEVGLNTENHCEFGFTNTGNGVLEIEQIVVSCGSCTASELEKGRFAPGESGTIKVKFYADAQPGQTTKNLTIYSNDRTNPNITLAVAAKVISKVDFEPKELHLLLKQANAGSPKITLTSTDGRPFSISHFKSSDDCITIDFDPAVKQVKFVVEPKIDMARLAENLNGRIEIGLTHPECPAVTMGVRTIPKFRFNPIMARGVNPNTSLTGKVRIISNYDENFAIASVSSKKGTARLTRTHTIGNGYELDVEITPPPGANMRIFSETLLVRTGAGDEIEIPCNVYFSGTAPRQSAAKKSEKCTHCGPRIIYPNGEIKARDF